jgi:negative regulator of flagellin synthesis FlgM
MNIPGNLQPVRQTLESYPASAVTENTASQPVLADQATTTASATDQTHLSTAANIVSQSASQTDVRTDKVASVQAAIGGGTYQVNASQVAGKLIDHMLGNGN